MRDDQVRRYARHILLPDVGGLGQTALMVAAARVAIDGEPSAAFLAASYLAAGGVGALVVGGATPAQHARLTAHGADTIVTTSEAGTASTAPPREVTIPSAPAWWPAAPGDATALAYWRGGVAAVRWMADVVDR